MTEINDRWHLNALKDHKRPVKKLPLGK